MPAKSDKQQTAAGIAHAIKKGKVKPKPGTASAQMARVLTGEHPCAADRLTIWR